MRQLVLALVCVAAGCGDDGGNNGSIDAPASSIDAPAGNMLTCANYCTTITANCSAANAQYDNMANCMGTCMKFAPGTSADMSGNTLGCRIYHAGAAQAAPGTHCLHAGPLGSGLCGTSCEGFCTVVQGACSAQAMPPYADMGACMTACNGFATTPAYSSSVTTGNSLACRMYHATVATTTPTPHCNHVKIAGGGGAGFPCQ